MKERTKDTQLEVEDFGPIVKAKIDLRPLTVFVGPSNTGKSYLAVLIYALHRVFGSTRLERGLRERFLIGRGRKDLSKERIDALLDVGSSLAGDQGLRNQGSTSLVLPATVATAFRSGFDGLVDVLSGEIRRCFGVDEAQALIRREGRSRTSRVVMRRHVCDQMDAVEHTMLLTRECEFSTTVLAEVGIPIDIGVESGERFAHYLMNSLDEAKRDVSHRRFAALDVLSYLGGLMLPSLVGSLHLPAYYLPADRTGVMHAHSVVVSALIASAPAAGLRPAARTPMLSGVLADFLEQLIEIDRIRPARFRRIRRNAKKDLGKAIEKAILEGSVRIKRSSSIDYPHFTYRPHGWKDDLALANASSMVSELAPVVLYLRHMVELGDVLIVEEPESHLHPAKQVAFTRQLAALVNVGVRVIITTHSEWLLEELANIVRRSQVSASERGDAGNDGVTLHPEQVGAWLFEPKQRPKGSVVKEIRLDDSGLYPSGYDEVAFKLHNEWADIESRIEDDP